MSTLLQELRYALRRRPGFTAAAVITLALGILANTAIFSVAEGVMLCPLRYCQPARLMVVWENNPGFPRVWTSHPNFEKWRRTVRRFGKWQRLVRREPI